MQRYRKHSMDCFVGLDIDCERPRLKHNGAQHSHWLCREKCQCKNDRCWPDGCPTSHSGRPHRMHWCFLWFQTSANLQKIKEFLKVLGMALDCQFKLVHQHMTTFEESELIAFASHHFMRDLVARLQGWTQSALKIGALAQTKNLVNM